MWNSIVRRRLVVYSTGVRPHGSTKRTVIKAMSQLENTEKQFDNGKYIKIILLYEDYLKPELLDHIMDMPECKIENDNYYCLATINELEMLFNNVKTDRKLFDEIILEKN